DGGRRRVTAEHGALVFLAAAGHDHHRGKEYSCKLALRHDLLLHSRLVLPQTPTIGPPLVTIVLSSDTTSPSTLNRAKLSTGGPPPGAVWSCVTNAVAVAASSAGQPAGSKVRLLAALATTTALV